MNCIHCKKVITQLSPILQEMMCVSCEDVELDDLNHFINEDISSYPNTLDDDIEDFRLNTLDDEFDLLTGHYNEEDPEWGFPEY